MSTNTYQNWIVERDGDEIVWLRLDVHDNSTNVLSHQVFTELQHILTDLAKNTPIGVAITSNKPKGFIAGADVKEFAQIENQQQALEKIRFGQSVMDQLDQLPCPTIAVINGFCMGGGLELSLACDYRIALDESSTRLSLPEIRLGIHPGYGGTVRIFRYVSPLVAMDLMLTGRSLDPRHAKKIGLIDYAVPHRLLEHAACEVLLNKPDKRTAPRFSKILNNGLVRPLVAMRMRKQISKIALPEHYPAPYALINHWSKHYGNEQKMLQHEAKSVAELSTTLTAKNLVRVFMLQNELKNLADDHPQQVKHVHIIGAGVMGGDIATWCVAQGLEITLQDLKNESLAKAKSHAYEYFKKRLKDRVLIKGAMDHFVLDAQGYGLRKADIIIEAVFENKKVKRDLYASLEPKIKKDALLVTNTSSIRIEELCDSISDPTRLVGLHFFNPVTKMPLIEIVNGTQTDPNVFQRAINFARQIGKLPLPTKSSPGFLVNRILTPYMVEAGLLKEAGNSIVEIDHAATTFGMPMGPIELADTIGLDVGLRVAEILSSAYGFEIPSSFKTMVASGMLGKKSGQGFYAWKNGKKVAPKSKTSTNSNMMVQNRLVLRFINEVIACHRERVVENKDILDAGVIFGTGFAPFRGGPIHYVESMGAAALLEILDMLHKNYGDRYKADPGWHEFVT